MEQDILQRLQIRVKEHLYGDTSGHGIDHLERTYRIAMRIAEIEGGDHLIIGAAVWLHDVNRHNRSISVGDDHISEDHLHDIETILVNEGFPIEKIPGVLHCLEAHGTFSFSNGKKGDTCEAKILQDADQLDAMGAIGLARTFAYGAIHGRPIWDPSKPIEKQYDTRTLGASTIHHVYEKLMRLIDNLNTKTAKKIAIGRHLFMESFVDQFLHEWTGADLDSM